MQLGVAGNLRPLHQTSWKPYWSLKYVKMLMFCPFLLQKQYHEMRVSNIWKKYDGRIVLCFLHLMRNKSQESLQELLAKHSLLRYAVWRQHGSALGWSVWRLGLDDFLFSLKTNLDWKSLYIYISLRHSRLWGCWYLSPDESLEWCFWMLLVWAQLGSFCEIWMSDNVSILGKL
jgi:hypothetical protein